MFRVFRQQFIYLVALTILFALPASAQTGKGAQPKPQTPPAQAAKPSETKDKEPARAWTLKVSKATPYTLTLKAQKASLTEIAAELGRQLSVPVMLSPVMSKQKITQEIVKTPLEATLRLLAPQAYIDYEVTGDYAVQPKIIAIYLYAFNEQPPPTNAVVKDSGNAILIEGDTEEGTDAAANSSGSGGKDDPPLAVTFEKNQLTVKARKQPLSVVLYEIANKLGVPLEVRSDMTELVDVNFSNYTVEQAVRSLSPAVRLYYRTDLQTFENKPLRIVLAAQAKS